MRQRVKSNYSSHVANAGVVAAAEDAFDQGVGNTAVQNQSPVPAKPSREDASSTETSTSSMRDIESRLTERGFSSDATSVMLNCWRPVILEVYNTYIQKWEKYAREAFVRRYLQLYKCVIS